jgi:hypothetical protein
MNILEGLTSGGSHHEDYQDFAQRYDQGHPSEGYSDEEVLDRHQQVAADLPPEQYREAAQQAFERLSPQEREEFVHYLQQQGYQNPALAGAGPLQLQDAGFLAQMAGQMQRQQPGMLGLVLGGGSMGMGGMFGSGGMGGMLSGNSMGSMLGGRRGGAGSLLGNPIAKAAMAGIARYAFKRMTGR